MEPTQDGMIDVINKQVISCSPWGDGKEDRSKTNQRKYSGIFFFFLKTEEMKKML